MKSQFKSFSPISKRRLLLLACVSYWLFANANLTFGLSNVGKEPRKYCGDDLIDVLSLVCGNRFYSPYESTPQVVEPIVNSHKKRHLSPAIARLLAADPRLAEILFSDSDEDPEILRPNRRKLISNGVNLAESDAIQFAAGSELNNQATSQTLNNENNNNEEQDTNKQAIALDDDLIEQAPQIYYPQTISISKPISQERAIGRKSRVGRAPSHANHLRQRRSTNSQSNSKTQQQNSNNKQTQLNLRGERKLRLKRAKQNDGPSKNCCQQQCDFDELKTYCALPV